MDLHSQHRTGPESDASDKPDERGDVGAITGRELVVEGLVKDYQGGEGPVRAVDGVSFTVEPGKFYTLLGPSGCGKSTTLRCVAGLESADAGRIVIGGRVVNSDAPKVSLPPYSREIGMVFQSYAIWPHMSVFENVAFPLRAMRNRRLMGVSRKDIRKLVEDALATVRLDGYEERMATKLSGGQQQRLALARALVRKPTLLLLDEPLSNLDAGLREGLRLELRSLQRRTGVTTLYVTHDQAEAFSMSNRIAVMENGRIVQEGSPREIYSRPKTSFVANFVGRTNFLDGTVIAVREGERTRIETGAGVIDALGAVGITTGAKASVVIRPEDVAVVAGPPPSSEENQFPGRVERVTFLGDSVEFEIRVGQVVLLSRQHPACVLRRRDEVHVELPTERCVVLSAGGAVGPGTFVGDDPDEDEAGELPEVVRSTREAMDLEQGTA